MKPPFSFMSNRFRPQPPVVVRSAKLGYLLDDDSPSNPINPSVFATAASNAHVNYVAMRTEWDRVEPHQHANSTDFFWTNVDACLAQCVANGKKMAIQLKAGLSTPSWVYGLGVVPLSITTQSFTQNDGVTTSGSVVVTSASAHFSPGYIGTYISGGTIPPNTTVVSLNSANSLNMSAPAGSNQTGVALTEAAISPMPVPWDTNFYPYWEGLLSAFATRYANNPNICYITMSGFGRSAESFFVTTPGDQAAADARAVADGYSSSVVQGTTLSPGLTAWLAGSQNLINMYPARFGNMPLILDLGSPYPTTAGNVALQALCDYGAAAYPGKFGCRSDGLAPSAPPSNSIGMTECALLSPTSMAGFQFTLPQQNDSQSDGVTTASSTTVTSASARYNAGYVGAGITGGSIPNGATITAVNSANSLTISAAATSSATGVTLTELIGPLHLAQSYTRAHGVGARMVETYASNCDDSTCWAAMDAATAQFAP